jgi:N-acetylglucosaminyl-diphospho-decaprenol L-rhamnosyltransferase
MNPQISVLIVSWNTRDLLRACLESLQKCADEYQGQGPEFEMIVLDNASADGSVAMLRDEFPAVRLIENSQNRGFGAANNQAARLAQTDYLLLLNPDTIVFPETIRTLWQFLEQQSGVGMVGPRVLNPDGSMQLSVFRTPTFWREAWRLFHLDRIFPLSEYPQQFLAAKTPQQVESLKGACILLRRKVVDQLGLFDEQFFMYSEEIDLCKRVHDAGWEIYWLPTVSIIHYGGESTRLVKDKMFLELYQNKIRYFRKHSPPRTASAYKGLLYITALIRWLFGRALGALPVKRKTEFQTISRQYHLLIENLPAF